jgi:hypothetical protein
MFLCVPHALPVSSSFIWKFWQYLVKAKSIIMQFSPAFCYFILLRSK